jgi:hypothetical protein
LSVSALVILNVSHNAIPYISKFYFCGLSKLKYLYLENNPLDVIGSHGFYGLHSLATLNLSNMAITEIQACSFDSLLEMETLDLSHNNITSITSDLFCAHTQLLYLDLRGNPIAMIAKKAFIHLTKHVHIESDTPGLCCQVPDTIKICSDTRKTYFASCTNLLGHYTQQYFIWIISLMVIVENVLSIYIINRNTFHKYTSKEHVLIHLFHRQVLSVSDLLMGFYLILISIIDIFYRGDYFLMLKWRHGIFCQMLGVLCLFSFELSLFMVLILSCEQFCAICLSMRDIRMNKVSSITCVSLGVCLSILISVMPVIVLSLSSTPLDNSLCLLMLSLKYQSTAIIIIYYMYNSAIAILTILFYTCIAFFVIRAKIQSKRLGQQRRNTQTVRAVVRLVVLALTNVSTWVVLATLGLYQWYSLGLSHHTLAWVVIIALPCNAVFNPIIGTFTTKLFLDRVTCKTGSHIKTNKTHV